MARVRHLAAAPVLALALWSWLPASTCTADGQSEDAAAGYRSGVYGANIGVYDEILNQTSRSPQLLHRAVQAPDWLVLAGQHRTRYETLNGRWRLGQIGSDQQVALQTRLLVGIRDILDPFRFLVEFQDARVALTDSGSFVTARHVNEHDIQRLQAILVSQNFLGSGLPTELDIGRINMDIARGRWISRESFLNTTQAFDGAHWSLGDEDNWHLRLFAAEPVQIRMRRLDDVAPAHPNRIWGLYAESRRWSNVNVSVLYIGHASEEAHRDFNMLSARAFSKKEEGSVHFEVESAYQFGDVSAGRRTTNFQHAEVGYTLAYPWKPEWLLRFDYASAGFDPLYGRRSFELVPTGMFEAFTRSNILTPGYRLLVKPTKDFYAFVQHRAWWLADKTAPWVGTGLEDPTGRSGRFIGQTVELRLRWAMTDAAFLQGGYVYFPFGEFPKQVSGGPTQDAAHYAYVSLQTTF